ncbi:MAG TPA: UvrD-helicase domain-containing protein, partial [Micromonosporaceae bacterium]
MTREAEIAREQRHVDRVYARVDVLRAEAERVHREGFRLARARTPGSLVERDAMVYHTARRMRALDAEYEGLVFGRLDLTDGEVRHIGRLGLRDADYEPLVIDWRAPGAAAFYQATTEEPMGVLRRRVIRCSGPKVLDVEDDLLDLDAATGDGGTAVTVVGDGALLATLARAKGERMRDIVATIQREQDEAIRAPAGGVTLIEGGPGTGKTAVALHRAAHLLYRDRRRFEGGGVLLVGPSSVFMSYVERVLPSLGEETAELRALGHLVDGLSGDRLDPPELAAVKGSSRMRRFLQRVVRQAPPGAPSELKLVYGAEVLRLRADDLNRLRRDLHTRVHHPNAAGTEVRRALVQALWQRRPEDVSWSAKRFADEVVDRTEFERFARSWWPVLEPAAVLGWLADPARVRQAGQGWLSAAQATALATSWAGGPADLSVADIALVDELRTMLGEAPRPSSRRVRNQRLGVDGAGDDIRELSTVADRYFATPERPPRPDNYDGYAHVLVDEAQDLSPMQWRMLGRRGRQASWTVVGDAAQSAWPDLPEALRARDDALRGKQLRRFHLRTNYRNSAEVFEFAASVVRRHVPDADLPEAVRRTGVAPEHHLVAGPALLDSVRQAVTGLLEAVAGTVVVITPAARRDSVAAALSDLVGVPAPANGDRATGATASRLYVLDGMRAKGMEYDGVVVLAPDEIAAESPAGVRVLYVALTRATHRLITIAQRAW